MVSTKGLILLFLIRLIACTPIDKKAEQEPGKGIRNTAPSDNSGLMLDTTVITGFNGDTATQINKTFQLIADFNKASVSFPSDTFTVYDKTTEGCEIIVAHNSTTDYLKFYGTLYGEMGQKAFSFYVSNGQYPKFFCVSYTDIVYNRPIYEVGSEAKEIKTSYEIYCDNKLIAILDEQKKKQMHSTAELKQIENQTRDFFKDYIRQIKLVK